MKYITKFDRGDYVFAIVQEGVYTKVICALCEGKGRVPLSNSLQTMVCPRCGGQKTFNVDGRLVWKVDEGGIVDRTQIIDKPNNLLIQITFIGSTRWKCEKDIFLTRKHAQVECDRRNDENNY